MIRLLTAAAIGFAVAAVGTRLLILYLTKRRIGQPIREDGPAGHMTKAGTPTMGGIAIVWGAIAGYVLSDMLSGGTFTNTGLAVIGAIAGAGLVGFLDDWVKVSRERNLGLNKRMKTAGLLVVALGFAYVMSSFAWTQTDITFVRLPGIGLPTWLWVLWAAVIVYAGANAVNLTDGLDGLAAGTGIFSYAAYGLLAFWIFRQTGTEQDLYQVPHALDLATIAVAMVGALAGFLWFNAAPAEIIMGDTGSLAIGTGLAGLAIATNTQLLLPILGAIYVIETVSVVLQVWWFRTTGGKRLFRMAPIHHHFELLGWKETKIIIRFWIVAGAVTAVAVGLFYADWVNATQLR